MNFYLTEETFERYKPTELPEDTPRELLELIAVFRYIGERYGCDVQRMRR